MKIEFETIKVEKIGDTYVISDYDNGHICTVEKNENNEWRTRRVAEDGYHIMYVLKDIIKFMRLLNSETMKMKFEKIKVEKINCDYVILDEENYVIAKINRENANKRWLLFTQGNVFNLQELKEIVKFMNGLED